MSMLLLITGCKKIEDPKKNPIENSPEPVVEETTTLNKLKLLNKEGSTVEARYLPPKDFNRVEIDEGSFADFLRKQKLKPYGEKVLYFDGREKTKSGVYDSVFEVDIGDRDLHQCADAIMLLRAEYLYSIGAYNDIEFKFVSGFNAEYKKWMEGYRIKVEGNNVSYYKATDPSNSYDTFRKYMDMIMAYSSTLSLEKELTSTNIEEINIGDVFIVGGSPGHAIIVVDMAQNENNEKMFLLAQSYMPAQQTQILVNPIDDNINPWYTLKGKEELVTPEWTFDLDKLKRFK